MALTLVTSGTLGEINVGLAAALGFLNPLGAQLDALIGLALGPLTFDLQVRLNAALALQATLSLQIGLNPLVNIQLALQAVAQLQAALQAALTLPPITLSLGAELSAAAGLAGALSARLGGLEVLIQAALAVKIPAAKLAAQLAAQLSAGPAFLHTFSGDTLATTGGQISSEFAAGLVDGSNTIDPGDSVFGVLITTKSPTVAAGLTAIFAT